MSDHPAPDTPAAWVQRARSDLALSRVALATPEVLYEDACFHAQQCAEKALKALLLAEGVAFPRTHALAVLLDLLQTAGVDVPAAVNEAFALSQYAVQTRYPGDWEPVTEAEAQEAVDTAAQVLAWVAAELVAGQPDEEATNHDA